MLCGVIGGSCHKYHFCRDKNTSFVPTKVCLLQQNFCCDKHNFVITKVLLQQAYVCHDKHVFVVTKHVFCHNESMLVTTNRKVLSWQAYFCHDKRRVLSQQTHACHDKAIVVTKIILVAAKLEQKKLIGGACCGTGSCILVCKACSREIEKKWLI